MNEARRFLDNDSLESTHEAATILRRISSINEDYSDADKLSAVKLLFTSEHIVEDGNDCISQWRDCIPFVRGDMQKKLIALIVKAACTTGIPAHQRTICASTLFERCFLQESYSAFKGIAIDNDVEWRYRVESAKYLFASELDVNVEYSQEALLEILADHSLTSSDRYGVITDFISRSGVKLYLNMGKLRIPYDEDFVFCMQQLFFEDVENDLRDRLLSGQHMLQMETVDDEFKVSICDTILGIADDATHDQRIRADAADIIIREGTTSEIRARARAIITDIGGEEITGKGLKGMRDIYADSENVHHFTEQVNTFIVSLVSSGVKLPEFDKVYEEVVGEMKSRVTDRKEKFKALKAMHRISVDTATFTAHKVTLPEIFLHVWLKITEYDAEKQEVLKGRLIEELCDMGDTCSSGHSSRFINVLSTYDETLKISWDDQIRSNIKGRLNASIRNIEDVKVRDSIVAAQTELALAEDISAYNDFITKLIPTLENELRQEFVGEGYVTEEEFANAFAMGTADLHIDTQKLVPAAAVN
ncbi:MAG: hypothetical protein L3J79_06760 [Candidatus Marinimicrobia bacterium]|nr:hypothetical protein [Candidatus Neomarinimicrobiota bacterium]